MNDEDEQREKLEYRNVSTEYRVNTQWRIKNRDIQ